MKRTNLWIMIGIISLLLLIGGVFTVNYLRSRSENDKVEKNSFKYDTIVTIRTHDSREIPIKVKVANNDQTRAKGLSSVAKLSDENGMIFAFPRSQVSSFWMKDCLINLDMIFIGDDMRVLEVKKNLPPCPKEGECPLQTPSNRYKYVVEVNGGWSDKNNVNTGDELIIQNK